MLISVPMRAKEAQPPIAQGRPQIATRIVAKCTLCTSGANIMLAVKVRLAISQATGRVGFHEFHEGTLLSTGSKLLGGRGVKGGFSSSVGVRAR